LYIHIYRERQSIVFNLTTGEPDTQKDWEAFASVIGIGV
jgi:hypothetical protein